MSYDKEFEREMRKKLAAKGWVFRPNARYDAASVTRLNSSWTSSNLTGDQELRTTLRIMRNRSREQAQNNPYMRKFLGMCKKNIIGPSGIGFQSKIKNQDGTFDTKANKIIESAWEAWGKPENCTVDGETSWKEVEREITMDIPRDGELLARFVRGFDNPFRFSLQLLEPDYLDELYNQLLPNGNRIVMGKEFNIWGRCVAYWLLTKHPGDSFPYGSTSDHVRVPAEDIIHVYLKERRSQNRGAPWGYVAMNRLYQVGDYENSELVAARIAARKLGFIKEQPGENWEGNETDDYDQNFDNVEAGSWTKLPVGMEVQNYDPQHPAGNFPYFMKAMLRGVASGLDVSYNYFASDLEGVNFSSLRSGVSDERDAWKMLQSWIIEKFHTRVFEAWLEMALLSGVLVRTYGGPLPANRFDKFNAPKWSPRGWDWVDPFKDIQASDLEYQLGSTTLTEICSKKGRDIENVMEERAGEINLINEIGKKHNVDIWKYLKQPGKAAVPMETVPKENMNKDTPPTGEENEN